ncbi:hypothetical protein [Flagellimonas pacifica]|uniref:Uncharacterized protein n=1 Tax=Flagellimonas pacifica TaxID=1247520 RepID=A0A285MDU2_9FLAO|nr:hypothetical protein [Allomuricauda parva]SNY95342.1 hypothetical protein SAMN06265377_1010 [Allomuricauda parva]
MKVIPFISFFIVFQVAVFGYGQLPVAEKLKLIETSQHMSSPNELHTALKLVKEKDTIALITFSKSSGELLEYKNVSKKFVINDLINTGYKNRYFVVLVGSQAIFFLDN